MANYIITKKAVHDLAKIWEYTFDFWSENQADNYYNMLINNFEKIAKNPNIGKNYNNIFNLLFGLKVGKHIIFYRKLSLNSIEITRILHEKMDLSNRILE